MDCDFNGQHVTFRRTSDIDALWFEKIAIIGHYMDEYTIQVTNTNYGGTCAEMTGIGDITYVPGPTITADQ